jgi:transmembrane sensor
MEDSEMSYDEAKRVARLIAGHVAGGLADEKENELFEWLAQSDENRQLYERIMSASNFHDWAEARGNLDIHGAWHNFQKLVTKERKRIIGRRIRRMAAVLLIPASMGVAIFFYLSGNFTLPDIAQKEVTISPGETKAFLVLDNGRSVDLNTPEEQILLENDGTAIEKGKRQLTYQKSNESELNKVLHNTLKIPRGGEYDIILSDGTRVYMNAMSELRYPVQFSGDRRKVELKGEAYFDVEPSDIPFIVVVNGLQLDVLGTSFNLNAYEDNNAIVTTLVDGNVKIITGEKESDSRILNPDEQAVFSLADRKLEVKKVDASLYAAWKDGEINFFDNRLEDIMITLTRWYTAEVFYMNPSVKELRFSGSLNRYGDIQAILDIIGATGKVKIEINKNAILFREI